MSTLLVQLPNQTQGLLTVAVDTLIYDGRSFVQPQEAKYVMLYDQPVWYPTPDPSGMSTLIGTDTDVKAEVLRYTPASHPNTDPTIVSVPDPSLGTCIYFITCKGTLYQYVEVTST